MNDKQRAEIERLAGELHDKRLAVQMHAATNTFCVDAQVARQNSVNYRIAQAEAWEAESRLEAAQRTAPVGPLPTPTKT